MILQSFSITTHSGVWQFGGTDRLAGLVCKILKKELLKVWVETSLPMDQLFQFFNTECECVRVSVCVCVCV